MYNYLMIEDFSVIIPTLDAQEHIRDCLKSIREASKNVEIIICDGGSTDSTLSLVEEFDVKLIHAQRGRGIQLNEGAKAASGKILAFFHADTVMPPNVFQMLDAYFADPNAGISKFRMKFDERHFLFNFYSWMTRFDSLWTSFGDQGIVLRRSFYERMGGFKNWPLFEDVEFFRRARKVIPIETLPLSVTTSARRFKRNGYVKAQLHNAWLILLYLIGIPPEKLYEKYYS